jgi:hypothetical protein
MAKKDSHKKKCDQKKSQKKRAKKEHQVKQLEILINQVSEVQAQLRIASTERQTMREELQAVSLQIAAINLASWQENLGKIADYLNNIEQEQLISEVGINYQPLINLLTDGKWRKADEWTWQVFLQIAGREEEGWLELEDIERLPCTDLTTINYFWEYYSHGIFGLQVQGNIWLEVGEQYTNLCDRLGWRQLDNWKYYDELTFNLDAPIGHLPVLGWRKRACYGAGKKSAGENLSAIFQRFHQCTLPLTLEEPLSAEMFTDEIGEYN